VPVSSDYFQYVLEQLGRLPRVTSRRMFGAIGLYSDGVFFGIIDNDMLFFKVDDSTRERYVERGSEPFRPYKDRPEVSMSYFHVPADVLEDADELVPWARAAVRAAAASAESKRTRKRAPKKRARRKTPPGA
jgi:DNA transformation protein and related proteins